jgi:hypothetical protein
MQQVHAYADRRLDKELCKAKIKCNLIFLFSFCLKKAVFLFKFISDKHQRDAAKIEFFDFK